ncbi:MAG: hypothetical protein R3F61_35965 [Myxococcota bacterium]
MDDRYRRKVPDPSATIPDFGPRPEIRVKKEDAKVSRMPEGDVAVGQQPPAPAKARPAPPPPPRSLNPIVLVVLGMVVAIIAGGIGFFVVVFAGMFFWLFLGG